MNQPDNQKPISSMSQSFYYDHHDDEIDLGELFAALWKGKWVITICTIIFFIIAVAYALMVQEWWSSKAKIVAPQSQDIASYRLQVKQYQPIFDVYQEDGTVLVSDVLDDLIDKDKIFFQFVAAFNSNLNKKKFLENSDEFLKNKTEYKIEERYKLYTSWYNKVNAVIIDKNDDQSPVNISFQSTSKLSSYKMMIEYVNYIGGIVRQNMLSNLSAIVDAKYNELIQKKIALTNQAKLRLDVEIQRAIYALDIARAAEIDLPIQVSDNDEIFSISLGSKAIEEKIKSLKKIDKFIVIEPRLQKIEAKLMLLMNTSIDKKIVFSSFRYLDEPEKSMFKDSPSRLLIVIFISAFGFLLSVIVVLANFLFNRVKK